MSKKRRTTHQLNGDLALDEEKVAIFSKKIDHAKTKALTNFGGKLRFICPGCGFCHGFTTQEAGWNNNYTHPTTAHTVLTPLASGGLCAWKLEDGKICFDKRSTHESSGLRIEMERF